MLYTVDACHRTGDLKLQLHRIATFVFMYTFHFSHCHVFCQRSRLLRNCATVLVTVVCKDTEKLGHQVLCSHFAYSELRPYHSPSMNTTGVQVVFDCSVRVLVLPISTKFFMKKRYLHLAFYTEGCLQYITCTAHLSISTC